MDISSWLERHASFTPNKIALNIQEESYSYSDLNKLVKQTAKTLESQLGIKKGDRVALLAYNCTEYITLLFACASLGAIFLPLNWRLANAELVYILKNADAKLLVLQKEFESLKQQLEIELTSCTTINLRDEDDSLHTLVQKVASEDGNRDSNSKGTLADPVLLVYTSGTTGYPKGALLSQEALLFNALNSLDMHQMTSQDHILTVLPLFHVGGLNIQSMPALYCGATLTLHEKFNPNDTLQAFDTGNYSMTVLVPTMIQACITSQLWQTVDLSKLRILTTGSTHVPTRHSQAFRERKVCVLEVYGSTETCPIAVYQRPDSDFSKEGTTGLSALHSETKVINANDGDCQIGEEGEILVRGKHVMTEYWNDLEATSEAFIDGWLRTGDIGFQDDAGYVFIKDRKKHMIISGGENIYPSEVERVLLLYPEIQECALIGIEDEFWGEVAVALYIADNAIDSADIKAFMTSKLAKFKIPKQFKKVDNLPKNAMGKVQYYVLKEDYT